MDVSSEEEDAVTDFIKRFDLFVTELSLIPATKLKEVVDFIDGRLQVIKNEIESAMDYDDEHVYQDNYFQGCTDTLDDEIEYFVDESGNLIDTRAEIAEEVSEVENEPDEVENEPDEEENEPDEPDPKPDVENDDDCKENINENVGTPEKKVTPRRKAKKQKVETGDTKPVRKKNVWFCDACQMQFNKRKVFTDHNKSVHHGELVYSCSLCDKSFQSQQGLECHQESRHPKEPNNILKCDEEGCEYETHSKVCLRSHRLSAHVKCGPYKCPICNKEYFGGPKAFRHHMQMHTGDLNYSCETCGKRFVSGSRLSYHIKQVHDAAKFQCETCAKVFKSKVNFERHILIHTNAKPFKCPHCPYCSNTSGNLSVHVRRKHGQKDFTTGMRDKLKKKELLTKKILETSKIHVDNPDNLTEVMGKLETSAYLEEMEKVAPGKVPSIEELKEIEQNNEIIRRQSKGKRRRKIKYKHVVVKEDMDEKDALDEYYADGNEQIVTLTNEKGEVIKAVINIGSTVEIQAFDTEPVVETYDEAQAIVENEIIENVIIEEEVEMSDIKR